MNEWQILGQVIENFMLLGTGILICCALYVMGERQVFSKHVKLSQLFPELIDLAEEDEATLELAEPAENLGASETESKQQQERQ